MRELKTLDKRKNGSLLLLDTFSELGVDTIFGYPGGSVLPLYDAIYDHKMKHILTRHEQGAVHAAEGYAKSTGKVGVVLVTSGPGATNAVTGIADAMSDSVPLIVITGQVISAGIGKDAFQEADMIGITTPITKYNYQIRDAREIPKIVREAFHFAMSGRKGPVVIDLPKDVSVQYVTEVLEDTVHTPSYQPTVKGNSLQIKKLLKALSTSEKPLLLVGGGVNAAQANKELLHFVEKYQIPVITTLLGIGALPSDHPLFLGMAGMHGSFAGNMATAECDLLLNIGARFDDRLASNPEKFAQNAMIAHIDIDPAEIGKIIQTDIPIVADAKNALEKLGTMEEEIGDYTAWQKHLQDYKETYPFTFDRKATHEIKPQRVIELLGKKAPKDTIVVTDVGQHQMWVAQFFPVNHSNHLITSGGLGTMGFGIPAAIGAKLANPEKEVILFVGDGGFQMTNQELAILTVYDIPIKIILLNNHSLGMVRQWQETFFDKRRSQSVFESQPDFMKLAESYHIDTLKLDDPSEVEEKVAEILAHKGPLFVEVEISSSEHVLPMIPAGKNNDEMIGVEKHA